MTRGSIVGILALATGAALFYYFYAGHKTPSGQAPLMELSAQSLPSIKSAFNEAQADVRVLVLLSPT